MPVNHCVLLTGATGGLGSYLLRDLLLAGRPVAVLARAAGGRSPSDRIGELVAFWSRAVGRALPAPTVLAGELGPDGTGLSPADERWLAHNCGPVLHAAASLGFHPTPDGEPLRSNVGGTAALLGLCRRLHLRDFHHVSTAFVCGRRPGPVGEDDLEQGQAFHNAYEQSKYEAERLVRGAGGLRATIYRPSILIGDSVTGYTTSYSGLYRVVQAALRLARPTEGGERSLPLRLPLTGLEPCNLVPVDWVARCIVELLARPGTHGRTFHLTDSVPASSRLIHDAAVEVLRFRGIRFAGPSNVPDPSHLERTFWEGIEQYWPYLSGTPAFDDTARRTALPHLPAPPVDRALLVRLLRFAEADGWGRRRERPACTAGPDCAAYVEQFFPRHARRSRLGKAVRLHLTVGVELFGPGGGAWSCAWRDGELAEVRRGLSADAAVTYRMDTAAFVAIVEGRLPPPQAFFEQRLAIAGDLETGLKLAVLFGQFLQEAPHPWPARTEATDALSDLPGCSDRPGVRDVPGGALPAGR